jgi:hypothetical protein
VVFQTVYSTLLNARFHEPFISEICHCILVVIIYRCTNDDSFFLCDHFCNFSSFLTPDRLEKLDSIGFVWSVRGESSSSSLTSEKNATNALPENKGESTTISVVDAIMAKPADTEQEGEEKEIKDAKDEGNVAAAALAPTTDGETPTVPV